MLNTLNRLRARRSEEAGFTLIELLITIVILGVLAGIVVFAVSGIEDESETVACKADKKNVEIAAEAYYAQEGSWAASIDALVAADFLREAPTNPEYDIEYDNTDGSVTSDPADCDL